MLDVRGLSKRFGRTVAVQDVHLAVTGGEVVGLVGENGAGKSTILKIIAGLVRPDAGEILVEGERLPSGDLLRSRAAGIRCAFQELSILPGLTVAENLALADPAPLARPFDWRRRNAAAERTLGAFEVGLSPVRNVGDLMLGDRYRLEIVRALAAHPRLLLLDESTAALSAPEVDWLERRVRAFTAGGGAVIFVSHRWDEIERFCSRVVVLRNGSVVGEAPTADLDRDEAVRLMSGQAAGSLFPEPGRMPGEPVLELADISAPGLRGITLALREGEVLGLAGLAGQGQEDVLRVVFGLTRPTGGRMSLEGEPYRPRTPRAAQARGIGFVPLDRKSEGLFLSKSMRFNLGVVARGIAVTPARIVSLRRERAFVRRQIEAIDIRPPEPAMRVGALSGGNQQKVLFQRVMAERPRLLLLADVTRGVDIQTKKELYAQVRVAADHGTAVLFYSTDTEELTGLCSRVAVFQRGRVVRELAGSALTRDAIVAASLAGSGTADAA